MIILLLFIGSMVCFTIAFFSIKYADKIDADNVSIPLFLLGMTGGLVAFVQLVFVGVILHGLYVAQYKAEILNREYQTSYTAEEVYWAGDVIDTISYLQRQRVELNGNLLQSEGR